MPLLRERRKPSKIYGLSAKSDEKLLCQLHAAKQLQVNNKLTYSQLHYLLADKSIPIPKIKYHLLRIHNQRLQQMDNNWIELSEQAIIGDAKNIRKDCVEMQWVGQGLSLSRMENIKKQFRSYEQSVGKEGTKLRMRVLKNQMTAYEGKMNMANSEDEVIRYRNLYQEAKQEYEYWKESRRKLKDLTLKETAVQGEKTIDNIKIEKIHQQVKKLAIEQALLSRMPTIYRSDSGSLQHAQNVGKQAKEDNSSRISQDEMRLRLRKIFVFYTCSSLRQDRSFDQMRQTQEMLRVEGFSRFVRDFSVSRLLPLDTLMKLFKARSGFTRQIAFEGWVQLLEDICRAECQLLKVIFTDKIMSAFLEGHIADSVKMKKQLTGFLQKKRRNPNDRTANPEHLREGTGSKYLYKVHPHTGKTEGDILEQLLFKKNEIRSSEANYYQKLFHISHSKTLQRRVSRQGKHELPHSRLSDKSGTGDRASSKNEKSGLFSYPSHELQPKGETYFPGCLKESYLSVHQRRLKALSRTNKDRRKRQTPEINETSSNIFPTEVHTQELHSLNTMRYRQEDEIRDERDEEQTTAQQLLGIVETQEEDEYLAKHLKPLQAGQRLHKQFLHF